MGERTKQPAGGKHQLLVGYDRDNSEPLVQAFSQTSAIGFAILDDQLQYQAINNWLATINGSPPKRTWELQPTRFSGHFSKQQQSPATVEYWSVVKLHTLKLQTPCCLRDPTFVFRHGIRTFPSETAQAESRKSTSWS